MCSEPSAGIGLPHRPHRSPRSAATAPSVRMLRGGGYRHRLFIAVIEVCACVAIRVRGAGRSPAVDLLWFVLLTGKAGLQKLNGREEWDALTAPASWHVGRAPVVLPTHVGPETNNCNTIAG
eukprot:68654-Chlamydomonas_euryale.AAC.10